MTVRTFFNKAIFKSNLKRFWVGGVLYLVILLFCSGFWTATDYHYNYGIDRYNIPYQSYFESIFSMGIVVPMIASIVVAVFLFRNVHSKKQSVFHHSLPVTRFEGYVSTLLSALTLMGVPVIITGIFVMIATGEVVSSIFWMLLSLLSTFTFLSLGSLSALLTGTGWVAFLLYAFFNFVIPLADSFAASIMNTFAHGYTGHYSPLNDFYIFNVLDDIIGKKEGTFVWEGIWTSVIVIVGAIAVFALAYLLYHKRKMERCEDISAYKWFNYFFKYAVTLFATLLVFAAFSYELPTLLWVWIIWSVIISFVAYFGTEMLLKKRFKVFGAYKGYIAFVVIYTAVLCFFAFTSIFGFETYVPEVDDVDEVTLANVRGEHNSVSDKESIKFIIEKQKEIISNEQGIVFHDDIVYWSTDGMEYTSFSVTYKNDEKSVSRSYRVKEGWYKDVMNTLYESETFKKEYEPVFTMEGEMTRVTVSNYFMGKSQEVNLYEEEMTEFLECIKKDMMNLSYTEIYTGGNEVTVEIRSLVEREDKTIKSTQPDAPEGYYATSTYLGINKNFTNSIKYLVERGDGYILDEEMQEVAR